MNPALPAPAPLLAPVRRVAVIGNSGAGKTTLSRRLAEITGLPLVHLDQEYWRPGWETTPTDQWRDRHAEIISGDRWVVDGNFGSTMAARIARADLVVLVDCHPLVALWRVMRRTVRHLGRNRSDMAPGCVERFDLRFCQYVVTWPRVHGVRAAQLLETLPAERVVVVRTAADRETLLARAAARADA